ncbi:MAG: LysR substrate-binding domain-containing protein [Lachnospiraceae bacterium]
MLDYRIKTFLTLCETMNYRQTAELLHITQPAVTQQIQWLEKYYGCSLFSYEGRKLRKTSKAVLLEKTARIMSYQEKELWRSLEKKEKIELAIGATKTIGEFVLGKHISHFLENAQHQIQIEIDNTETILEKVERGRLDFALIEGYFNRENYGSRLYRREAFQGICSASSVLADRQVEVEEILSCSLFVREQGSGTRKILEQLLEKDNFSLDSFDRLSSISNFGIMLELVEKDLGITFAYEAVKRNRQGLSGFRVKGWETIREFNYVYLSETEAEKKVEYFHQYSG